MNMTASADFICKQSPATFTLSSNIRTQNSVDDRLGLLQRQLTYGCYPGARSALAKFDGVAHAAHAAISPIPWNG
jgi:hypothetical protein